VPLPWDVPVDIGRDEAAAAARAELSKGIYQAQQPSWVERVLQWLQDQIRNLLERLAEAAPGGALGLLLAVLVVVLVVALLRARLGPVRRSSALPGTVFVGRSRSAAEHRQAADQAATAGRWAEAVRERFRAVVRGLEERDVLDARPGRTADEMAAAAARVLPALAGELVAGARRFDEVAYGEAEATAADDARLRALDDAVEHARPAFVVAPSTPGWAAVR